MTPKPQTFLTTQRCLCVAGNVLTSIFKRHETRLEKDHRAGRLQNAVFLEQGYQYHFRFVQNYISLCHFNKVVTERAVKWFATYTLKRATEPRASVCFLIIDIRWQCLI